MLIFVANLLIACWILVVYTFFIGPLITLGRYLKRAGLTSSFDLLSQQVKVPLGDQVISLGATFLPGRYLTTISIDLHSAHDITFSTRCRPGFNFFIFTRQNIFTSGSDPTYQSFLCEQRSALRTIFSAYDPLFETTPLDSLEVSKNRTALTLSSAHPGRVIPNLPELLSFIREVHDITVPPGEAVSSPESSVAVNRKLVSITAVTVVLFMLIGMTFSLIDRSAQGSSIRPATQINSSYIQVWEIYKDHAMVYDLEKPHNDKITLITDRKVALDDYEGFKPELVPWGFRVAPKRNFQHHYKVLILPKETDILGYINFQPIRKVVTERYLILTYDLSSITSENFIKIYMRYAGNLTPIDIDSFMYEIKL